jgi:4-amino-4-deoxy-L-arabinose transferase-like glycosyltransferase
MMNDECGMMNESPARDRFSPFNIHHSSFRILLLPLIALLFILPTVPAYEFSFGSEAVNVATALEIRRTNYWIKPTLQGDARLNKPPLTAWLTAAAITGNTLHLLDSDDPAERALGQQHLAWQARLPSALLLCAALIAIFELGVSIRDPHFAILATLIAMSSLLFLRHVRWAQTDTQLAVWVTICNAFLCRAIFKNAPAHFLGAGIALGLAILAKGPIALIMTALPMSAAAVLSRHRIDRKVFLVGGIALAALIGGSWFLYIAITTPGASKTFFSEVTRYGANDLQPDSLRNYLRGLPILLLPWTPFAAIGAVIGFISLFKKRINPAATAVLLVFIPLLIMLPFKERKERYLAPLLSGSALLSAAGISLLARDRFRSAVIPAAGAIAIGAMAYNLSDVRRSAATEPSLMKPFAEALWTISPRATLLGYESTDPQSAYLLVPGAEMSIYLNRSVQWTTDPSQFSNPDRDLALFVIGSTQPRLSADWQLLRDETRRHMRRTLYLRKETTDKRR